MNLPTHLSLALTFLFACGPTLDGQDGDASTLAESSTGEGSSSEESTSEDSSTGEGGSTSESSSTGADEGAACFGEQCTGRCAAGLLCAPHPSTAGSVCVTACNVEGQECTPKAAGCGVPPIGECREGAAGALLCFPVSCGIGAPQCASGECVDGRCY